MAAKDKPVSEELATMQQCYDLLERFPQKSINRMLTWLHKRLVDQPDMVETLRQRLDTTQPRVWPRSCEVVPLDRANKRNG